MSDSLVAYCRIYRPIPTKIDLRRLSGLTCDSHDSLLAFGNVVVRKNKLAKARNTGQTHVEGFVIENMNNNDILKPKLSLLNDHGSGGEYARWKKENGLEGGPYCLRFSNGKLSYIGVQHTYDANSDTYKLIEHVIERERPEIVIVEGIDFSLGLDPDVGDFGGEGGYAIKLAKNHKSIHYVGIEESEEKLMKKLLTRFRRNDVIGYDFLRAHKFAYRTMRMTKKEFFDDFTEHSMFRADVSAMLQWFERTFGKKFRYGSNLEYASPYNGEGAVITQIIGAEHSKNRDKTNIKNLYRVLNLYNKVVFIMGENHVYADKDVLIGTFGMPKIEAIQV